MLAVRQNIFLRPTASNEPQPGNCSARTHQLHKATPGISDFNFTELTSTIWELTLKVAAERLILLELGEAAPVALTRLGLFRVMQDALHLGKLKVIVCLMLALRTFRSSGDIQHRTQVDSPANGARVRHRLPLVLLSLQNSLPAFSTR